MYRLGMIGVGRMGGALVQAIMDKGILPPRNILLCEKIKEKIFSFIEKGARSSSIQEVAKVDILIIAVEPADVGPVLTTIKEDLDQQLIVSIAAGVSTSYIRKCLGKPVPVVRIMPNTAVLVGEGTLAYSHTEGVEREKLDFIEKMLKSVGYVVQVPEEKLDAVTGLSGSGPAYVYATIKGMMEGGKMAGLPEEVARDLAIQTILGAAKLTKRSNKHIGELISSIITPHGTTAEGMKVLEKGNYIGTIGKAVLRASERAKQIRKELESNL